MTRGQIAVIKQDYDKAVRILTSIEFNGDMYMPTKKWAGHGQQVINALRKVNDTADYQYAVAKFNKDHHHYNDCESLTRKQGIETLDFTKDYFENWFSDYVYIKNITSQEVKIITSKRNKDGEDIGKENHILFSGQIAVLCFGRLVKIVV